MIVNNDVLLLSATNEETPYEQFLRYPKRSGTCIIVQFEVERERETGTEFCRIALWYCFRILSPFLLAITRWRRELDPNSPPRAVSLIDFNGKLLQTGNYSCHVEIER